MVALVLAVISGAVLLFVPSINEVTVGEPVTPLGVGVNTLWVIYDLVVMSVIIQAALYRAPSTDDGKEQLS
jgi:cellulose synthase (UDP-forming)